MKDDWENTCKHRWRGGLRENVGGDGAGSLLPPPGMARTDAGARRGDPGGAGGIVATAAGRSGGSRPAAAGSLDLTCQ